MNTGTEPMVSTPKAPDPYATADAQSQYNTMTAETQQLMNMTDQVTPYGNVTYAQNGTTSVTGPDGKSYQVPRFTQTTTLNPQQQSTLDSTQAAAGNIANTAQSLSGSGLSSLSRAVDTSGAPALQSSLGSGYTTTPGGDYSTNLGNGYSTNLGSGYQSKVGNGYSTDLGSDYNTSFGGDVSQAMTNAKNAVMDQYTPTLDRNAEATRAQELASGVRAGSAAYSANEQTIGDNYTRAADQATQTAQSVQNQLFNQQQQQAAYTDNALLNKANYTNNAALNQAQFGNSALLSGAQFGNEAALNQFNAQNNAALTGQQFSNSALLSGAQFNNDARNQYLSQYYQQRDQPLNELSALLSQSQVNNANTATSATPQTQVGGVDYAGQVNSNYQAKLAQSQGLTSGLFGLGTGAMSATGLYFGGKK